MLSSSSVACIIVNYNGFAKTLACLDALSSMPVLPHSICAVDNGSRSGESDMLLRAWTELCRQRKLEPPVVCQPKPNTRLRGGLFLPLAQNMGFAAGNNAALRMLLTEPDCQAFWLLNNDALPQPDALEALVRRMNQRPDAGMAGSSLIRARDSLLQTAAGVTLNPLTGITRYVLDGMPPAKISECDERTIEGKLAAITAASCLVNRAALEHVGLMDESFFLYFEDVDWSLRFRKAGYALAWAKGSMVVHEEGGSIPGNDNAESVLNYTALVDYLSYRNRLRLMLAHYPLGVPTTLLSFLYAICKRFLRGEPKKALRVAKTIRSALCNEQGKPNTYKV
ncbi:MAG: glycosyltransferase family 2 protein [Desulfovibrio sp.]|jgi:GT2 family glycosyltransferase|nr:glycosyltransferase family 2 protein [Desulfovibrio sp.]